MIGTNNHNIDVSPQVLTHQFGTGQHQLPSSQFGHILPVPTKGHLSQNHAFGYQPINGAHHSYGQSQITHQIKPVPGLHVGQFLYPQNHITSTVPTPRPRPQFGFLPINMGRPIQSANGLRCAATPMFKISYPNADRYCLNKCRIGRCPSTLYCNASCRHA